MLVLKGNSFSKSYFFAPLLCKMFSFYISIYNISWVHISSDKYVLLWHEKSMFLDMLLTDTSKVTIPWPLTPTRDILPTCRANILATQYILLLCQTIYCPVQVRFAGVYGNRGPPPKRLKRLRKYIELNLIARTCISTATHVYPWAGIKLVCLILTGYTDPTQAHHISYTSTVLALIICIVGNETIILL